jgi:hypothetical protein
MLGLALVITAIVVLRIPSWRGFSGAPCLWVAIGAINTLITLCVARAVLA